MAGPPTTYESLIDLSLGSIPQVDDPELYRALLDIHNAIESLLKGSDAADLEFRNYIAKKRNTTDVNADYTVLTTDGSILVDTTAGDVTITLPEITSDIEGYEYDIKQVAGANQTTVVGDSASDPVDGDATGITMDLLEAIPVKNDGTEWWIHN